MAALFSDERGSRSGSRSSCSRSRGGPRSASCRPPRPRSAGGAPVVDAAFVEAVAERERVTDHDVAAFVDVVQEAIGPPEGSWIHYGLTSSDVVDSALSPTLSPRRRPPHRRGRRTRRGRCTARALSSTGRPVDRAAPTACTPSRRPSGRSSPFGAAGRARPVRLGQARDRVAVGKLSGAVGTYSNIDPGVEAHVCAALGLVARARRPRWSPATGTPSSSTPARRSAATIEAIATEIRHLARSEVGEVEEPFGSARRAARRCPTSATRSRRAPVRPGPGAPRLPRRRAGGRRPLARAGHLPLLGRAGRPARRQPCSLLYMLRQGAAASSTGSSCIPTACGRPCSRAQPRPGLLAAGPARAGRRRPRPRRRLPHRPA